MAKKLWSIFTDRMDCCFVTHLQRDVEIHHIFGGWQGLRKTSERMGYTIPLHKSVHVNGAHLTDKNWVDLDHWLKRMCQEHFILNGGTKEEWYDIFGKFYDDRDDEKTYLNGTFTWGEKHGDI